MENDWIGALLGEWSTGLTLPGVLFRLALSVTLSAIIGCERSSKRHSAGLFVAHVGEKTFKIIVIRCDFARNCICLKFFIWKVV